MNGVENPMIGIENGLECPHVIKPKTFWNQQLECMVKCVRMTQDLDESKTLAWTWTVRLVWMNQWPHGQKHEWNMIRPWAKYDLEMTK